MIDDYFFKDIKNMFGLGMPEIILIALVILLLFGGAKLPELMRGLGKGVRGFKEGLNDVEKSVKMDEEAERKETAGSESDRKDKSAR